MSAQRHYASDLHVIASDVEFKSCCAAFYSSPAIHFLLGDVWHPGGLALTEEIVERLGLREGAAVLDVACGQGSSVVAVARRAEAKVVGIDLGRPGLRIAEAATSAAGLAARTRFAVADAEWMPFADASFDAVLCECAFCTFPVKERAAGDLARVLRPGGRVALADVTREPGPLPEQISPLMTRILCIGDALPLTGYEAFLRGAGLRIVESHDCRPAADAFLRGIEQRLLLARLAQAVGKLPVGDLNVREMKRIVGELRSLVAAGRLGYGYVIAEKPDA